MKFKEFRYSRKYYYFNFECGNLLTLAEMLREAAELYDCDDDTNACELAEYYGLTDIEIPAA